MIVLFPFHSLTYPNLFILISLVLFAISWLFSTFIKMSHTKGSVCIRSLSNLYASLCSFRHTAIHQEPGKRTCRELRDRILSLRALWDIWSVFCVILLPLPLLKQLLFLSFFFTIATKIRVSLFSCSLVMRRLRALGRGHFQATCHKGISGYK